MATTPIEALDVRILKLCTHFNAAKYELLMMIRKFDERGGCLKWGLESTPQWLAWRCDLSMATAREKAISGDLAYIRELYDEILDVLTVLDENAS